jgi:hypothetical protein
VVHILITVLLKATKLHNSVNCMYWVRCLSALEMPDCRLANLSRELHGLFQSLGMFIWQWTISSFLGQSRAFCWAERHSGNGQSHYKPCFWTVMCLQGITAGHVETCRDRTPHCTLCRLPTQNLEPLPRLSRCSYFWFNWAGYCHKKGLTRTATVVTGGSSRNLKKLHFKLNQIICIRPIRI